MKYVVTLERAKKDLRKAPRRIIAELKEWASRVELHGLYFVQTSFRGYYDHTLQGNRKGQRSISLNYGWRAIYTIDETNSELKIISVEEVTNHKY